MKGRFELNNIYCEDSYKAIKDIPDKSIDCIYTDIPYLYQSGGMGNSDLGRRIQNTKDEMHDLDIYNGIDLDIFNHFTRVMKKVNIFIWCSRLQLLEIMNWFNENTETSMELMFWGKTNPTPSTNNKWLPDVEYCLYFREKGVKLNDGYDLKSKFYVSPLNKGDKDLYSHPTIKPLNLVKQHLQHTTQQGDVILDPFIGSGTTAVAAKELDRNYIGFEIDEKYHKIAVDRVNGITAHGQTSIFTDFGD